MTNARAAAHTHDESAFSFALPSDSRVASVEAIHAAIQSGMQNANSLQVQGAEVADADAAIVQLLLLVQRELKSRGGSFQLQSSSPVLQSAIRVAGAETLLLAS